MATILKQWPYRASSFNYKLPQFTFMKYSMQQFFLFFYNDAHIRKHDDNITSFESKLISSDCIWNTILRRQMYGNIYEFNRELKRDVDSRLEDSIMKRM